MKISILYGSVRENRMGIRAALYIRDLLEKRGHDTVIIDPLNRPLPLLNKMFIEYSTGEAPEVLQWAHDALSSSDGFILVSGEYNHSIPPTFKNVIDHYQKEYHYKPSALVTYSAGPFAGVRVMPHLRAITGELGMPSIPTTLPISRIKDAIDENGVLLDTAYERRTERFLTEFDWYLEAFKEQRGKSS